MKVMKSDKFLTDAELEKIRKRIESVEKQTSGEIVPVIIDKSSDYRDGVIISVFLMSFVMATAVMMVMSLESFWYFITFYFISLLPSYFFVRRFPRTQILFIPKSLRQKAVRKRAVAAFYENGLYRTKDETGVLIFISLLERSACILGDRGINSRISQDFWNTIISALTSDISRGENCKALLSAIDKTGKVLAENFPVSSTDQNELPDDLVSINYKQD